MNSPIPEGGVVYRGFDCPRGSSGVREPTTFEARMGCGRERGRRGRPDEGWAGQRVCGPSPDVEEGMSESDDGTGSR